MGLRSVGSIRYTDSCCCGKPHEVLSSSKAGKHGHCLHQQAEFSCCHRLQLQQIQVNVHISLKTRAYLASKLLGLLVNCSLQGVMRNPCKAVPLLQCVTYCVLAIAHSQYLYSTQWQFLFNRNTCYSSCVRCSMKANQILSLMVKTV